MTIKTFQCNPLQENCYVVSDDSGEAVVIDCGAYYDAECQAIAGWLTSQGLTLRHVLCTHGHMDHVFGVGSLYEQFGVKPRLHPADAFLYDHVEEQTRRLMGMPFRRAMPPQGEPLKPGEEISFGSHRLKVLHAPGHTPGCVLLHEEAEGVVFSGDVLFRMSVGRTDLEGSSWQQMMNSLHDVVAKLPPATAVYPGHGPATRMEDELMYNPYLGEMI